ncbi:MAG: transglutaminase domain-containing protein [Candidatus Omnitrophica bacterium]|nr:transglutaminase domain-containing protein [Candidatus Omnitrophota bacterium]
MKKAIWFLSLCGLIGFVCLEIAVSSTTEIGRNEQTFFVKETISIKNIPRESDRLCVWIPYPTSDNWQNIRDFRLLTSLDSNLLTEREYGNRIIYLKTERLSQDSSGRDITLSFTVERKETGAYNNPAISEKELSRFLKADRFVPVDGKIRDLAMKITEGVKSDMEKAKAIYDYIIREVTYSKDDPNVCGIGSSLLTLQHKKGICSDYHSLFISMARSLGIPAKFEIGFPIPEDKTEGMINGYHCWAKFYLKDKGWIPVDLSEAYKHPEKREYFFGHIDGNRFLVTTGRDIRLEYAANTEPLNFFVYPYVEIDGRKCDDVDLRIFFKKLNVP